MVIIFAVAAAAALVFFGYIALYSAHQTNMPQSMSKFGKVIAIVLFIAAALMIIGPVVQTVFRLSGTGRPNYGFNPMMRRQQGTIPFGTLQNRPNFAVNRPGQTGTAAVPAVMPNQAAQPNTGPAAKRVQLPENRKAK